MAVNSQIGANIALQASLYLSAREGDFHVAKRDSAVLNAGRSTFTHTIQALGMQLIQCLSATQMVNLALKSGNYLSMPLAARAIVCLTPVVLTLLIQSNFLSRAESNLVQIVESLIYPFSSIATVVSSIALIFFGQALLGVISLGVVALGMMLRPDHNQQFDGQWLRP